MNDRKRRNRAALVLVMLAVGGYLAVARWKAVHPAGNAPRVTGPALDLKWWRR